MKKPLFITAVMAVLSMPVIADFDFDEMEALEQTEQAELLELAREAARRWNFSQAEDYLEQAQNKGYAPDDVRAVEQLIANNRAAQARQEAEERRRREEQQRREEEQRRLAQQRRQYSGGSTSGGEVDFVMVQFDVTCGLCIEKDLNMSGGPGSFSNGAGASGAIHKGYNGIAGTYQWTGTFDNKACSGSVYISGKRRNVTINVYDDCRSAGVSEF